MDSDLWVGTILSGARSKREFAYRLNELRERRAQAGRVAYQSRECPYCRSTLRLVAWPRQTLFVCTNCYWNQVEDFVMDEAREVGDTSRHRPKGQIHLTINEKGEILQSSVPLPKIPKP